MKLLLPENLAVSVIAPAGKCDSRVVTDGVAALCNSGAKVQIMPHVFSGTSLPYLAADDAARCADIMNAATDGALLWAVRGGYGCARILPLLDWEFLQKHPVTVAGFSDITALHWALTAKNAGTAISAPMLKYLAEINDDLSVNTLFNALAAQNVTVKLPALRGTAASGTPLPGNLTVAASLAGTDFFPDTAGKILILEDVGEAPYRIDRALTQLILAGAFDNCAAVVFGNFTGCGTPDEIKAVLDDFAMRVTCPVFSGFPFGHELPFFSLSTAQKMVIND